MNSSGERFFGDLNSAGKINIANLTKIIKDNKNTNFGKTHGFDKIKNPEDFRKAVRLCDYSKCRSISKTPEAFTVYEMNSLLATSGSTGKQKFVPISKEALRRYSTYVLDIPLELSGKTGKIVHTNVFRPARNNVTILSNCYFNNLSKNNRYDFSDFVGGKDFLFGSDFGDVHYMKAVSALSNRDLFAFHSIFLYDLSLFFSYIEKNWKMLLSDMRNKKFSASLSPKIEKMLLDMLPEKNEIDELEKIFEEGFETPIVPRIWKNIAFVGGIGGKIYRFQEKPLKKYIGDVPIHYSIYASSECMMGIAPVLKPILSSAEYVLMPRNAYYEFIPRNGRRAVTLDKIKIGEEYEVVLTTFSGLYRYKTGDIIRINSFIGEAPVFEMIGRRKLLIDISGEKIDVFTMTEAVDCFAREVGATITDFAVGINHSVLPNGYYVFLESEGNESFADKNMIFDGILRKLSPDYSDMRNLFMISAPKTMSVHHGDIFESVTVSAKLSHKKPKTFIDEAAAEFLLIRSEDNGK